MELMNKHTLYRLMNNIKGNKTTKANEEEVDNKLNELINILDKEIDAEIKELNSTLLVYIAGEENLDKIESFIRMNGIDRKKLNGINRKDLLDAVKSMDVPYDMYSQGDDGYKYNLFSGERINQLQDIKKLILEMVK